MATNPLENFVHHMFRIVARAEFVNQSDQQLLQRYVDKREELAFGEVVRRYGAMVWAVCLRVLEDQQDAEDAFQATFLIMVQRTASAVGYQSIDGWLYTVAHHAAIKAKLKRDRRRLHEERKGRMQKEAFEDRSNPRELAEVLDKELAYIPDKHRGPLILCYLEGLSREQAAQRLGLTVRNLDARLSQGRQRLQQRLSRHGIDLGEIMRPGGLSSVAAFPEVPSGLMEKTLDMVRILTQANGVLETAGIPTEVAILVKSALGVWTLKSKMLLGFLLVTLAATGAGIMTHPSWLIHFRGQRQHEARPDLANQAARDLKVDEALPPRVDCYGDPLPLEALVRLGTTRLRHTGTLLSMVQSVASEAVIFTPDNQVIVTAGKSNPPRLWSAATGQLLRQLRESPQDLKKAAPCYESGISISSEGRILPNSMEDRDCFVDFSRSQLLLRISNERFQKNNRFPPQYRPLAISPNGKTLANGVEDRVDIWDLTSGRLLHRWLMCAADLKFAADGKTLVAASHDGYLCVWSVANGHLLRECTLADDATGVALSLDGKMLVAVREKQQMVQLWDVVTGKKLHQLSIPKSESGSEFVATFSPDSRLLATAFNHSFNVFLLDKAASNATGGRVYVWDVVTGREVQQMGLDKAGTRSMAFSPDGKLLATGSAGGPISLWEVATGKKLRSCQGYRAHVAALAFSSDGKRLATRSAGNDYAARLWQVDTGLEITLGLRGHTAPVLSVAFTPDGKSLVSGSRDGTVGIWDAEMGWERRSPLRAGDFQSSAALSVDGRTIVSIGNTFKPDGRHYLHTALEAPALVRIWDTASGQERCQLPTQTGFVQSVSLAPDGKAVAATFAGRPKNCLKEIVPGKETYTFDERNLNCVAISPDHKLLAIGHGNGDISLWDKITRKQFFRTKGHSRCVKCLSFSPDGQWLATTAPWENKPEIRLWHFLPQTGWQPGKRMLLREGEDRLFALAFSPDNKMLAAAGMEGVLYLWETTTGKERSRYAGHHDGIRCLTFAPDGRRIASGSGDTTILIWDITGRLENGRLRPARLTAQSMHQLWANLASDDALRTGRAIWTLVAAGSSTVSFLKTRLRPETRVMIELRPQQLADLNELISLNDASVGVLQNIGKPLETTQDAGQQKIRCMGTSQSVSEKPHCRIYLLPFMGLLWMTPGRELLRELRAIEVLEQIGSHEARQLLEVLSSGIPEARLTHEARAAFRRLERMR